MKIPKCSQKITVGWLNIILWKKFPLRTCCAKENKQKSAFDTADEKLSKQTKFY